MRTCKILRMKDTFDYGRGTRFLFFIFWPSEMDMNACLIRFRCMVSHNSECWSSGFCMKTEPHDWKGQLIQHACKSMMAVFHVETHKGHARRKKGHQRNSCLDGEVVPAVWMTQSPKGLVPFSQEYELLEQNSVTGCRYRSAKQTVYYCHLHDNIPAGLWEMSNNVMQL